MSLNPPRPLPVPLNALRAFEVAARHGSFLRASEELSVTPGAVAQQVRKLEDWAGARLFERQAQGVRLTPVGGKVLAQLTAGFEQIGHAARALRQASGAMHLRIAALPAIAQLWLGPRLSGLRADLPGFEISIHALDGQPPLTHGAFDLALYPGDDGTVKSERQLALVPNKLVPVATPEVAAQIRTQDDLAGTVLIHDAMWRDDWAKWCAAASVPNAPYRSGPVYSLYSLAVERCLSGDGVLIGHTALLGSLLQEGRLVALFPKHALPGAAIAVTVPEGLDPEAPLSRAVQALHKAAEAAG